MERRKQQPLISFVFPVLDEEENLELLYSQILDNFPKSGMRYEMVFVDNCSSDSSLPIIKKLAKADKSVKYISLSRNFGHQGGLFAGLCMANGDAVITMDADLQHPPDVVPEMIKLWQEGNDVVNTVKGMYKIHPLKKIFFKAAYFLISKLSGLHLSFGQSDFRLLDRKVIDVIVGIPEQPKFLRGMVSWIGFKQTKLKYDVAERHGGIPKYSLSMLFHLALDGIVSFSTFPLRLIFILGIIVAFLSFCYCAFAIIFGFLSYMGYGFQVPKGWSGLMAAITFLGGVQLVALGIIGEYIGRIHLQCKNRPIFIVNESSERLDSNNDFNI